LNKIKVERTFGNVWKQVLLNDFAEALKALEGHAEYVVKGRYDQKRFLNGLLEENDQARALRDDIQAKPEEAARNSRIALGELIANTVEAKRQADTQTVVGQLNDIATQVNVREPTSEWDAVHVALLAEVDREQDVQDFVDDLNEKGKGQIQLRLLGPLAPYDFVVAPAPGS
jgi:hypothetical protein